ncbi:putative HC-toxin efflux carrier TOXA 24 [Colletotrichum chlorophyti]|uniref:Putative HC-toxin efflux carrier TOXA 24 n=1 Tax=Colletotrichum chlorophyti TaxID=708187 RepID=A0A1Q8RR42_9PEZI|nr:putative HC-toxin efflux carrier TOXA 24 [Colletotrichum chlorophyti]
MSDEKDPKKTHHDLDRNPSPDALEEEKKPRRVITPSDSDERTAASASSSSLYSDEKGAPPPFSEGDDEKSQPVERPSLAVTATESDEQICSHCGHHRRESVRSSITLANPPNAASPTVGGSHRKLPLAMGRTHSYAVSDVQTFHTANDEDGGAHSETASIISSIFAPPLRHLASQPSLHGSMSTGRSTRKSVGVIPVTEQRHPGKAGARISRFTRPYEPDINEDDEDGGEAHSRTNAEAEKAEKDEKEQWLEGWPLTLLIVGICIIVFLISTDQTIITVVSGLSLLFSANHLHQLRRNDADRYAQAIPYITGEFQSTADIGWYGSAYLLTACAFQPVFGRVYMLFSIKWSYLLAMFLMLVGSVICGAAPNSFTLIIGRAVAGFGSAGILTGSFVVVAHSVPLRLRPIYTAIVGLVFGFGATVGPLLGGVFTDLVTWRWCFYINLPVGAVTVLIFLWFFRPKKQALQQQSFLERIMDLDLPGNVLLLGACVQLFLALEYTTQGQPWGAPKIIGLLAGAGATAVLFAAWQWWKQDGALIPPSIITQRTVAASCIAAFTIYGALLIHTYFLPIWFQAIRGGNAISSGVDMIPYVATNAVVSLLAGVFVSIQGYYAPPAIIGGVIGTIGCGTLRLLSTSTTTAEYIGFEILVSAGMGMAIQQGFTAVQVVLTPEQIPIGTAAVVASQSLGGAIFVSVGNTLFQGHLMQEAAQVQIPGVDIGTLLRAGATAFRNIVPPEALPQVLEMYNEALRVAFTAAIPLMGIAAIAACFMEFRSVKGKPATMPAGH